MLGAQRLGALWRLYPKTDESRTKLLIDGLVLRSHSVQCLDKNPFIVRTKEGDAEIKTTKLTIGNIPISYSNKEIEETILKLGCKPQSKLYMERDRDERGGLTRWLTGRRFLYIEVPERPLPPRVDIGNFKATLFHFEQKALRRRETSICGRCLERGHDTRSCANDIVCHDCRQPGHRKGDPECTPMGEATDNDDDERDDDDKEEMVAENTNAHSDHSRESSPCPSDYFDTTPVAYETASNTDVLETTPTTPANQRRGRATTQTTLTFQRSRSHTPAKRQRDSPSSGDKSEKFSRIDTDSDNRSSAKATSNKGGKARAAQPKPSDKKKETATRSADSQPS